MPPQRVYQPPMGNTPPASPPPQPPMGNVPPPVYGMPPPKKKSSVLWWILGCGCLLAILALGVLIYGGAHLFNKAILPELQKQQHPTPPIPGTVVTEVFETKKTIPTGAAAKPGEAAAKKAALAGHSSWVAKVKYFSPDWQRAKVWIGPPASEFVTAVVLRWDPKKNVYIVENMEGIPQDDAPMSQQPELSKPLAAKPGAQKPEPVQAAVRPPVATTSAVNPPTTASASSSASAPTATGPRPSRRRAIAKCVAQAPEGGWVGKVISSNAEATECTVLIGPANSEFVQEFTLEWIPAKHNYAIRGRRTVGGGEG